MPPKTLAEIAEMPPEAAAASEPQGALRSAASTRAASARRVLSLTVKDRDGKTPEGARALATAAASSQKRDRRRHAPVPRPGSGRIHAQEIGSREPQRQRRQRSRTRQSFEHRRRRLVSGSLQGAGQSEIRRRGRQAAQVETKSRLRGYRLGATDAQRARRLADKRRPLRLRPLASVQLVRSGTSKRSSFFASPSFSPKPRLSFALARAYRNTLGHARTRTLTRKTARISGRILVQTALLTFRLSALIAIQTYRLSRHLALALANWERARRDRARQKRLEAEESAAAAVSKGLGAASPSGIEPTAPFVGEGTQDLSAGSVDESDALGRTVQVDPAVADEALGTGNKADSAQVSAQAGAGRGPGAEAASAAVGSPAPAEVAPETEQTHSETAAAGTEEADESSAEDSPPAAENLPATPGRSAPSGKPPPQTLPYSFCRRYGVLIERDAGDHLIVLRRIGSPVEALLEIHRITGGAQLKVREIPEEEFSETLNRYYESGSWQSLDMMDGIGDELDLNQIADSLPEPSDLMESDDEAPVIRLINAMLTEAIRKNASDIHVEPFEKRLEVRFRIDGVMHRLLEPPREIGPMLTSRIKVMANLDIAEKRVPQDGRISLRVAGRPVDVRVSSLPSGHGERVVMRLLNKEKGRLDLDYLGMEEEVQGRLKDLLKMPHGILLITGPTGSGKTTTLYSGLTWLNDSSNSILTIEDPIEYYLDGIGQTQVNTKVELTFARGLRAILRQDPDIVMVGEIRDLETAEIAVQASLTGHLVLSTLHTNTAIGAVTRLQDMGVEPFLLSSSLVGVVSQRLVRVLCDRCRKPQRPAARECELLSIDAKDSKQRIYHPEGCDHCTSGYAGRTAIYEVLALDEKMRDLIHSGASENELERHAHSIYPSIFANGRSLVLQGKTTIEELLRVTRN